jgi:hypothetical protein
MVMISYPRLSTSSLPSMTKKKRGRELGGRELREDEEKRG